MSWTIAIDDGGTLDASDEEAAATAVTGILMGAGADVEVARTVGRTARKAARQYTEQRRVAWSTQPLRATFPMPDGRTIRLASTDLPEDPTERCDGYDTSGDKCGGNMNHLPPCRH